MNEKRPMLPCYVCMDPTWKVTDYVIPMCSGCAKTYGIVLVADVEVIRLSEEIDEAMKKDLGEGTYTLPAMSSGSTDWDFRFGGFVK